jgi:WbqC-like protein
LPEQCNANEVVSGMTKKLALVQSNYIPWKGYFDLINMADEFILFDNMQYTRRDWRNRNRIMSPQGAIWLTIPVEVKGKYYQKINETVISDPTWNRAHWKTIVHNYARAEYFHVYKGLFEDLYLGSSERYLSQVNYRFMVAICGILGINTRISWSTDYYLLEGKTERIVDLCKQTGATEYISGPTAKGYTDEGQFQKEGILLRYMDYSGYPEHRQLFPPFEHRVSIIDLIFNEGPAAAKFMKSF